MARNWAWAAMFVFALPGILGCALVVEPDQDSAGISRVRDQLIVLPIRNPDGTYGSCFPTSRRNLVTAAHVVDTRDTVEVLGRTTEPLARRQFCVDPRRPRGEDWVVLGLAENVWHCNDVDPEVTLSPGDTVYFGGYSNGAGAAAPEVFSAVVFRRRSDDADQLFRAHAPWREYPGLSGGPVAVLGGDGRVKIVGVAVAGATYWDPLSRKRLCSFIVPSKRQWERACFDRFDSGRAPDQIVFRKDFVGTFPRTEAGAMDVGLFLPVYLRDQASKRR
ncbi:MAG TPA: trypsin-like peptidase domain-containing protein [Phycisphaerae bacterium]|nr:trypsin-like peptidase domain-containing protein [Phycisphaerae bacterium]HRW53829.1 trypsin-like peptidase domain-containing protein [Phycisphaerae bacterium]